MSSVIYVHSDWYLVYGEELGAPCNPLRPWIYHISCRGATMHWRCSSCGEFVPKDARSRACYFVNQAGIRFTCPTMLETQLDLENRRVTAG
jgi:hypothetical protein